MRKSDFQVGTAFYMGVTKWRCTDVGGRVIVAIRIDDEVDERNLEGPPYQVVESVVDEIDRDGCSPDPAQVRVRISVKRATGSVPKGPVVGV